MTEYRIEITEAEWHEIKKGLPPVWWLRLTARFSEKNREILATISKVQGRAKVVEI